MRIAQQQLWRTIPPRNDHVGIFLHRMRGHRAGSIGVGIGRTPGPCSGQTKIRNHHLTMGVDKDIGSFDIAVHEVVLSRISAVP